MLVKALAALAALALLAALPAAGPATAGDAPNAHRFAFTSIDGEPLPMSAFAGKAVMVVNTASRCGFTYQYDGLQKTWEAYRDRGLVVLGVPSNDFAGQEPGSEAEIKRFCEVNFDIGFPMTSKVHVRGGDAHPFYRWAAEQAPQGRPGWNFHKYLVTPDGRLAGWLDTGTEPDSAAAAAAIEAILPAPPAGG